MKSSIDPESVGGVGAGASGSDLGPPAGTSAAPGAGRLFLAFLGIGLSGFGGVLPFARRALVDRLGWLGEEEFNETLALCQTLPGPNVVNLSVVVGARSAGPLGAAATATGLIAAPAALVVALATLWARFGASAHVAGAIRGLGAAAAGLVAATALKMARPVLAQAPVSGAAVMLAAALAVAVARAPLPAVMAILAPLSLLAAWRRVG